MMNAANEALQLCISQEFTRLQSQTGRYSNFVSPNRWSTPLWWPVARQLIECFHKRTVFLFQCNKRSPPHTHTHAHHTHTTTQNTRQQRMPPHSHTRQCCCRCCILLSLAHTNARTPAPLLLLVWLLPGSSSQQTMKSSLLQTNCRAWLQPARFRVKGGHNVCVVVRQQVSLGVKSNGP